jgi:hypothetical protein
MPKRHDGLFPRIANFQALMIATKKALIGKRRKPGAAAFCANLERELLRLECTLLDGSYRPGRYVEILIKAPKERLVSAALFRDRVVHHALYAVVCPIFEAVFIANSYANRAAKGTHRAIAAYERYRDRHDHVLHCDIFRYFPSSDHAILKAEFRRRIACKRTLALMDLIVDGSNPQEPVNLFFPATICSSPVAGAAAFPSAISQANSSQTSISIVSIIGSRKFCMRQPTWHARDREETCTSGCDPTRRSF